MVVGVVVEVPVCGGVVVVVVVVVKVPVCGGVVVVVVVTFEALRFYPT